LIDQEKFAISKKRVREAIETYLAHKFTEYPDTEVCQAAQYAVLGGGNRWRPIVAVAAGQIFREDALRIGLPGACGVELAHAASLVLDDLPSMDNAAVRRGKPATHEAFPNWVVDLTPMFLVNMAYQISLENPLVSHKRRVTAALELSRAGLDMIAGQVKDIEQDFRDGKEKTILQCYRMKSGVLYSAAAKSGGILCGANDDEAEALAQAGLNLGISFQLLDDAADVIAGVSEAGKQQGMDSNKTTSVDLYGLDGAQTKSMEYKERALQYLECFGHEAEWLRCLVSEASYKAI